ncbi:MAG: hypothetical protein J2P21_05275 [Chloracidobacterium sp.]|nr:hypothetical protein [Chloracidobacterium sp.]
MRGQWRERLAIILEIPLNKIGQIGGGKKSRAGAIDVGMLQSEGGLAYYNGIPPAS